MVVCACNPTTQEAEFQNSLSYIVTSCLPPQIVLINYFFHIPAIRLLNMHIFSSFVLQVIYKQLCLQTCRHSPQYMSDLIQFYFYSNNYNLPISVTQISCFPQHWQLFILNTQGHAGKLNHCIILHTQVKLIQSYKIYI